MSEKNTIFKSAIGGYNKNDVNAYITAVSAEIKAKDELYRTQRARLEKELEIENKAKETLSGKLDELGFELFTAQSETAAANQRETELKNTVMGLSERVAELEEALGKAEQSAAELEKIGELVGIESGNESEALHDKLSERISEIMQKADSNAEQIMTGAMQRADELVENAQNQANEIISAAENEAKSLRDKYKNAAGDYYEEVAVFVNEIREHLEGFMREIGAKSAELEHKIEYMQLPGAPSEPKAIDAECKEKPSSPEKSESKEKKTSTLDDKIEKFFKNTMAAINAFRSR
ncbi:MAG: hypothetical protein IKP68_07900 [Clostridia bacterium]|nr:hypothetical protein [Clostridia bacterium]